MTQPDFAAVGGVQKRAQIAYEGDDRAPDASYLAAVAAKGVDVLYVLTGARQGGRGSHAPPVDAALFAACLAAADEALAARDLSLSAERRARLYWALYELSLSSGKLNEAAVQPLVNAVL